jgi:flagellar P-ring protein precursor FlgI
MADKIITLAFLGMNMNRFSKLVFIIFFILNFCYSGTRVKDIAYIQGVRGTQVIGYGIVIGLNNSGDTRRTIFTSQSIASMLKRFGITVQQSQLQLRNVAGVIVTGTVDPFMKQGAPFDITVSSLGDASSLQGGTLLMTPLSGIDGIVYAMAQGPVSIGGYDINTYTGSELRRNHSAAGRVPNGAILDQGIPLNIRNGNKINIILRSPDFTTAKKIADAINAKYPAKAIASDAATVSVIMPNEFMQKDQNLGFDRIVDFISDIEVMEIEPDVIAKVVINEKTGTIVVGEKVTLMPAAVAHGNLTIEIQGVNSVFYPSPISQGQNIVLEPGSENGGGASTEMIAMPSASTVQDIATALNSLKVNPRDIIAIFQALKEAGALKAELIIL